jgi:hypothetical protein
MTGVFARSPGCGRSQWWEFGVSLYRGDVAGCCFVSPGVACGEIGQQPVAWDPVILEAAKRLSRTHLNAA